MIPSGSYGLPKHPFSWPPAPAQPTWAHSTHTEGTQKSVSEAAQLKAAYLSQITCQLHLVLCCLLVLSHIFLLLSPSCLSKPNFFHASVGIRDLSECQTAGFHFPTDFLSYCLLPRCCLLPGCPPTGAELDVGLHQPQTCPCGKAAPMENRRSLLSTAMHSNLCVVHLELDTLSPVACAPQMSKHLLWLMSPRH